MDKEFFVINIDDVRLDSAAPNGRGWRWFSLGQLTAPDQPDETLKATVSRNMPIGTVPKFVCVLKGLNFK